MKKNIMLSFFLGICFSKIEAQNKFSEYYFKNFPTSPSTATFLRHGDIQNSEYTGTNSPQIPLLTVEHSGIKIPLILKYISGNGIKVAQESGSVGLGWDINLPSITQSILGGYNDFDDVAKYLPVFTKSANPFNNYFPHSNQPLPAGFVSQPTKDAYSYYKTIDGFLPLNGSFADLHNSAPYIVDTDTSPDIFTCNLFGEKLEFVINNYPTGITPHTFSPTFYCLNKIGYKILYNTNTYFTITDPTGIKYYFSKSEDVKTLNSVSKNYVITKITDINNNDINFTYNEYPNVQNLPSIGQKLNYTYGNQTHHYPSLPLHDNQNFTWIGEFDEQYPGSSLNPLYSSQNPGFTPRQNTISTTQNYLLINSITGIFGKVIFYYSDRIDFPTQKLDKIEERTVSNQIVNTINFGYSYFDSQNSENILSAPFYQGLLSPFYQSFQQDRLTKRLKLLSVTINNNAPYIFNYNEVLLPSKHSTAVDYWGYFNGGLNNKTLFLNPNDFNYPTPIPLDNNYNNNFKQPNISYAKSAILTKIIYPTKGSSSFEYEMNTANNLFYQYDYGLLNIGNGLRLKSQINKDFNEQFSSKTNFQYFDGSSTNPVFLFNKNTYSTLEYSTPYGMNGSGDSQSSGIVSMNSNNNNSASPLSSGDYIGYSKVIRSEEDAQGNSKGTIVTNYANSPDFHYYFQDGVIPVNMPSSKSIATENGKVLKQTIFDSSMNKLKQTDNTYLESYSTVFYGSSLSKNARSVWNFNYFNSQWTTLQHGVTVLGYYPIFSKESLLTSSVTTEYIDNKEFVTQNNYGYNSNNNLSSQVSIFPDGGSESTTLSYAQEANQQKLLNANMISVPLFKVTSRGSQDYSSALTKYDDPVHLNPTSVVSGSQYSDMGSENKTEVTYDKYDSRGNLLQYTTKEGIPTTIIWGYNQTQPIARIIGIKLSDISQTLINSIATASDTDASGTPGNDESAFLTVLDNFRKDPSIAGYQITTYTYDPLIGVRSITPPSGIREVYIYDSANRLKEIRENSQTGNILKEFKYNYKN